MLIIEQQGKTYRCNAPHTILYSFILLSDAEAEEGEGKPLFGSSCSGAENKHVSFICQSTGCKRKSTNTVTFCVINTALLFFPNTFFQACVDFYCLLMVHFSFKQKRPNQNSSEYTCKCKFYPGTLDVIISFSISGHL